MPRVASRELRNHTAAVLAKVADGTAVTITVNGSPVADLVPHRSHRQSSMSRSELSELLEQHMADPGLREDLARLAGDTTDDLPLR